MASADTTLAIRIVLIAKSSPVFLKRVFRLAGQGETFRMVVLIQAGFIIQYPGRICTESDYVNLNQYNL